MTRQELIALGYPVPSRGGKRKSKSLNFKNTKREILIAALGKAGGNRAKAAEILGISVRTLYNWMKKLHDIDQYIGEK